VQLPKSAAQARRSSDTQNPNKSSTPSWPNAGKKTPVAVPAPHSNKNASNSSTSTNDQSFSTQNTEASHTELEDYVNMDKLSTSSPPGGRVTVDSASRSVSSSDAGRLSHPWGRTISGESFVDAVSPMPTLSPATSKWPRHLNEPTVDPPVMPATGKKPVQLPAAVCVPRTGATLPSPSWKSNAAPALKKTNTMAAGDPRWSAPLPPATTPAQRSRSFSLVENSTAESTDDDIPPNLPPPRPSHHPANTGVDLSYVVSA